MNDMETLIRFIEQETRREKEREIIQNLFQIREKSKIRRGEVYTLLACALGEVVSNQFVERMDDHLLALGAKKGATQGRRTWQRLALK